MCTEIQYKDKVIDKPSELTTELGIPENGLVVAYGYNAINMTIECLCQVDVPATLDKAGYSYEMYETGYKITEARKNE